MSEIPVMVFGIVLGSAALGVVLLVFWALFRGSAEAEKNARLFLSGREKGGGEDGNVSSDCRE